MLGTANHTPCNIRVHKWTIDNNCDRMVLGGKGRGEIRQRFGVGEPSTSPKMREGSVLHGKGA